MTRAIRQFFGKLGPGLLTGAADNEPSGIGIYSITGAAFGFSLLWTVLLEFPLMVAVQLMCARLSMVSGLELSRVLRQRYPRLVLGAACLAVAFANTLQTGAALIAMAEALDMVTGISPAFWSPAMAAVILFMMVATSYHAIARVLKWIALVLFGYVAAAFLTDPRWTDVVQATFVPHVEWTSR